MTLKFIDEYSSVLQALFCSSDPASHPLITKKESDYLNAEIGQLKRQSGLPSTPWKKITKSKPVIALLIAQVECR